ncbi:hypothetical protein C5167_025985 [Papaver somniferum]|uniref:Short-chain dehydrogenase/reductase n=1 Tax=Papaver somniferum TaxID=3469 RepID=A0A4Y7JUH4_PAPSO|nr:salutaridine reductase-like [Papaver somniferum]RZC64216.1 hypothetical protein C5167_025985 [Papaver somniferum]
MALKEVNEPSASLTRWWSENTVAVVTGGNRGIGFSLVQKLAELGLTVILTCRDDSKGQEAIESLKSQGLNNVRFFRLDVMDTACINELVSWLKEAFGGLDILVNNAAVSFNEINENSVQHAETTIKTNYYGPKLLTEALLPLFRRSESVSRILNVSSRLGLLNKVSNPVIRELLEDEDRLCEQRIDFVVNRFLEDVTAGTWEGEGWPKVWTDYAVSKVGLNAYSRVLAKRYDGLGLSVNCLCPGFTQTDMTAGKGNHSADSAAEMAAQIVLLPPEKLPTGKFYIKNKPFLYSKI